MVIIIVMLFVSIWILFDYFQKSKGTDWKYVDLLKNLDELDVWDGVEQQIKYKMKDAHATGQNEYAKFLVRWRNDPKVVININLHTVAINRLFWESGLSANDFAKQYYASLGITKSEENYNAAPNEIQLYNKSGICETYRKYFVNDDIVKDEEAKHRSDIIAMMKKTPYKAFTQLTDEINDGSFGIKSKIEYIHHLKNGFYPYPIMKHENGHEITVYLTFAELRKEVASEYSVYELGDFRWGTAEIDEKENEAQEKNLSDSCKRVNKEIKDYLWKHYHDIIIAVDKEDSFKHWSYRFQ